MASGINSTFRQVGIATGIAAWGAIFQHVVRDEFVRDAARAGLRGARSAAAASPTSSPSAAPRRTGNPQLARLGEQAFVDGAQPPAAARGPARAASARRCAPC